MSKTSSLSSKNRRLPGRRTVMERRVSTTMARLVILLALVSIVSACAEAKLGSREEAIRTHAYKGSRDEVFVEAPKITPTVVKAGDRLTLVLPFSLLAPQKETTFKVVEIVTMSGEGILMELSRRESEKPQGTHTSSVQLVIPGNLPRGKYTLTTTIIANGVEKKRIGSFAVDGR